jgi:DtxR family transcriptional regulator, Mn-dependent transcriptional regulator
MEGYHPPLEEYLEAVHELQEDSIPVIQARLAERLGHSAPTVSETIRRLRDEGYVDIDGRTISLTKKGKRQAESVVRKHRLAERLLTDVIGMEWHKAHMEATRWEHVISDEVEERLVEVLGHPATCPHGNPIPGAAPVDTNIVPLSTANVGQSVRLERVTEQVEFEAEWLTYLGEHEFVPGAVAKITQRTPSGDLILDLRGTTLEISAELAALLYIAA